MSMQIHNPLPAVIIILQTHDTMVRISITLCRTLSATLVLAAHNASQLFNNSARVNNTTCKHVGQAERSISSMAKFVPKIKQILNRFSMTQTCLKAKVDLKWE